jgi:diphthine synthase
MSIPTAVAQLVEVESSRQSGTLDPDKTLAIALSRVGAWEDGEQRIVSGTLTELARQDPAVFGEPLHSLVIVGKRLHHLEVEYAGAYAVKGSRWKEVAKNMYGCALE